MASRRLEVTIVGDASSLHKAFGQAGNSASGFGSKMAKVGKIAAIGIGVGIGVAAVAVTKFAQAALDAEKSQTRLDAAFKHAGASAKEQAKALQAVNDVSVKSGLDDEALADSLARLTQVTGSAAKAQKDMALAADVARGRGISLEAATQLVTKAAIGNVGALKRMGIVIPAVTTNVDALRASHAKVTVEQLKAAAAADVVATKQAALAALQAKFGGDAEAYGKTASGAMDRFKVAIENVEEGLGKALLPTLGRVAGGVADFLDKFNQAQGAGDKFRVVLDSVKKLATDAWTSLKTAFNAIQWGQVWESVKDKLSSVDWSATARAVGDKLIQALNGLSAAISRVDWNKVGAAIGEGIKKGVAALASVDWGHLIVSSMKLQARIIVAIGRVLVALGASLLSGLLGAIKSAAAAAGSAAQEIGLAIVQGILAGVTSLPGMLADKLKGMLGGALSAAKNFIQAKSPSQLFASEVGEPIALGIALGIAQQGHKISEALQTKLEAAIEHAKTVIESHRASFGAAWDTFAGAAGSAFDAVYGNIQTKSEKALEKLQATAAAASRAGAINDARAALAEAKTGGDPAAILSAQRALDAALLAQQEFALQQAAAKERLQLDARIALKKEHFQKALTNLQTHLTAEGATHQKAHTAIMALFKKFGVEYSDAGAALGDAFAAGLRSKTKAVQDAAEALAAAAARPIKLRSPAEVGPLSQLDHFWDKFVPTLTSGLNLSGMTAAVAGAVTFPSSASSGGGAATSGPTIIRLVLDGRVISEVVRNDLIQVGRRNGSALGGFA